MAAEKTEAIVIRHVDFSETSKIVTLFSRDFGKLAALAKGARRLKSAFEAALDLLCTCQIVFLRKSSSGLDLLTESQLISRFHPAGHDVRTLYGGYYVAELLDALTEPYDPHPELYRQSRLALDRLSGDDDLDKALLRFEFVLLREIGQLPAFDSCLVCGSRPEGGQWFSYWVSQGGLICRHCRHDDFTSHQLSAGTLSILQRLAGDSEPAVETLTLSPSQTRELRSVATAAISHILGHRPKMLPYLTRPVD